MKRWMYTVNSTFAPTYHVDLSSTKGEPDALEAIWLRHPGAKIYPVSGGWGVELEVNGNSR